MTGWTAGVPAGHATGISRNAQLRHCPTCKAHILAGYDHDIAACIVTVDTTPLTTHSEAAAILTGRRTYDAETTGSGHIHLEHRHQWRIRAPRRWTVLAAHACPGTPLDLSWLPGRLEPVLPATPPF